MFTFGIRSLCFVFFLLLFSFALLQLNDPDPALWTGFYFICSLTPLLLAFRISLQPLLFLNVILSLIVMGFYLDGALEYLRHAYEPLMQSMSPDKPYIEEAREFIGAVITLGTLVTCGILDKFQSRPRG